MATVDLRRHLHSTIAPFDENAAHAGGVLRAVVERRANPSARWIRIAAHALSVGRPWHATTRVGSPALPGLHVKTGPAELVAAGGSRGWVRHPQQRNAESTPAGRAARESGRHYKGTRGTATRVDFMSPLP